ncbi:MAG: putative kinase [Granulosicoccus sp.]
MWLETSIEVLKQRINQRHGNASNATLQVLQKQVLKTENRLNSVHVDASGSMGQTIDNEANEL